ncbi:Zn-dependent protease with chaperone function [Sagittula marina]|uniref:Zn-dependent protease with chaperone function n=1 Tax=Sagittula marina TaxID=943940 RepID=A0A7W6GSC1_9RHOB|nr:M48 family metallopeptidase [Sagittula marina]MBB3986296.1 Zn-dependent protease with chaperone function [Sagittula marina]
MQHGTEAQFFDGLTAARHRVTVALTPDKHALIITGDSLPEPLHWRLMDIRALSDTADDTRLTVTRHTASDDEAPRDVARLVILDPDLIRWLNSTRPDLFKTETHPGALRKLLFYAAGAIAATALVLLVILPAMADTLARLIPIEREVAFGKAVTRQMERQLRWMGADGDLGCASPKGSAALDKLLTRLTDPQDMAYQIELQVFDHPMVNAFAAPGGQVVILRGLLDKANSPEEVAGVLAHELGHVESRDATRLTLRAAGSAGILTMIIGDFTGGAAIALIGENLLSASYTREAEGAADVFALDMLADAQVDAEGFADFFGTLAEMEPVNLPEYLSSHPVTANRAAQAEAFAETQSDTTPILTDAEWRALQSICD